MNWWKRTSPKLLQECESFLLDTVISEYDQTKVYINEDVYINTVKKGNGYPLVLIHGYGGGIGLWIGNINFLADRYTVYAIDLLGFGRSSRPTFEGKTIEEAENYFLDSLELWRMAVGLDNFYLLGHSFGAYLSGLYTLRHPECIKSLILADPWGVNEYNEENFSKLPLSRRIQLKAVNLASSPLQILRIAGPLGPKILGNFHSYLTTQFEPILGDQCNKFLEYVYHCNAQDHANGEKAFSKLTIPPFWAKSPLINRLVDIDENVRTMFLYGQDTWMRKSAGRTLTKNMKCKTKMVEIKDAGHHVYVDNFLDFNEEVITFLEEDIIDDSKEE
jgi:abhydrolase domain-containing protein 4/abhydrolase domain-containing protein 5